MKKVINLVILLGLILIIGTGCTTQKLQSQSINKEQKIILEDVGDLNVARVNHSAVLLKNGNVLLLGGYGDKDSKITGEIYNSKTKLTSFVSNYSPLDITQNKPILLDDGDVIIFCSEGIIKYDTKLNKFKLLQKYPTKKAYNTIAKLYNGSILVIGGEPKEKWNYNIVEIYKPQSNSLKVVGQTNLKRINIIKIDNPITLKNNKLLILDENSSKFFEHNNSEIYNPLNNSFLLVNQYPKVQTKDRFNYLASNFLLYDSKKQEYINIEKLFNSQKKELGDDYPSNFRCGESILIDNKIILTLNYGGNNPDIYSKIYLFDILSNKFEYLGDLNLNYQDVTLIKLNDNKIFISGGYTSGPPSDDLKLEYYKKNVIINTKR